MEKRADFKIMLEVDEAGVYDYEKEQFMKFELDDYKKMVKQEAKLLKKMKVIHRDD